MNAVVAVPCCEYVPVLFWLAWMRVLPLAVKLVLVARKLEVSVSVELPLPLDDALKCPASPPPE